MIHLLSLCFFLIFPFSAKTTFEDGYLELQVNDPASRAVKGVEFTCAQGCATSPSDDAGRVRLKLPPNIKSNDWVYLKVVSQSWALISPWNSQLNVPSFANSRQNITTIIVARKGDKQILSSGESIKALLARAVSQANQFKSLARDKDRQLAFEQQDLSDVERKLALREIADSVGLTPEELDIAIREWGQEANDPFDRGIYELYKRNYPKADQLLTQSYNLRKDSKQNADAKFADVALNLGQAKYEEGKYNEAIEKFQEALASRKNDAEIMKWLGNGLLQVGKYAAAEPFYKRALTICEKTLGKDHHTTAIALDNLAVLYDAQGKYADAEPLYKRALLIFERTLGKDHPDTAISLDNLAVRYDTQGRYAEAEPLHKRALSIFEETLGKNHPTTATSLNNLAEMYNSQGKYTEAEMLHKRALTIREETLGKNHPTTAISLNNLALLYEARGKYADAAALYKRALLIFERTLGKDHPDYLIVYENYTGLLEALKRKAKRQN
jgi:tetratricopeptide (TPR) repeat protein